jgi:calcineurin-like phosphoesterase family protein
MTRVLAVADEVVDALWTDQVRAKRVDLVLAAGDLPFDYLEFLADALESPCVFVPGNHDRDLTGYARVRGLSLRAGFPAAWPGPRGWVNADAGLVDAAGLRIVGLGGSMRYRDGPNQWTERQQKRRMRAVARAASWRAMRDGRAVDVLLTHAPPRGVGDGDDRPHRGFACFHDAVRRMRPKLLLHGHIHPHGERLHDWHLNGTTVVNAVGYRILDVPTEHSGKVTEVGHAS